VFIRLPRVALGEGGWLVCRLDQGKFLSPLGAKRDFARGVCSKRSGTLPDAQSLYKLFGANDTPRFI